VLALLLGLTACTEDSSGPAGSSADATCQSPVETPFTAPPDGRIHVQNGTQVTYPTAPPAAGVHWAVPLRRSDYRTFYSPQDRPAKEQLVHSLEHGFTIVWYDETLATDSGAVAELQRLAGRLTVLNGILVVPWKSTDGADFPDGAHLALTHWTGPRDQKAVHQYCTGVSTKAVADFAKRYTSLNAPEPGAL